MSMKNVTDNSFTTSDFYAAAFLVAKGYKLLGIDKADSRRFHFIFTDEPYRPQLVSAFFAGVPWSAECGTTLKGRPNHNPAVRNANAIAAWGYRSNTIQFDPGTRCAGF